MNQSKSTRDRLRAFKAVALGSVVFFSTFGFPLINEILPFGLNDAMLLLAQPFIMGFLFAMSYGKGKLKFVILASLGLTALGMLLRFIMEYGEVSNARNFTPVNILIYLGYMTVLISLTYLLNSNKPLTASR